MKTLRTILQIPLLLLILLLGSVTGYEVLRAFQTSGVLNLGWEFYRHLLLGVLEVAVLVWLYRRLGPPAPASA